MKTQKHGGGKLAKTVGKESVKVGSVTVRIYGRTRSDGYQAWEVADYSSGVRRFRSFAKREEAIAEAERIARLLSTGDAVAAAFTGKDSAAYGRALELLRPTGKPVEVAAALFAEAVKLLGDAEKFLPAVRFFMARDPSRLQSRTVAEVAEEFYEHRKSRGASARYLGDIRARLRRFAEAFAVQVASVTAADIQAWLDGKKASPQTVKNFRTLLGTLFKFAERRDYIVKGENPVTDTEAPKCSGGKVEIYTPSEVARLLAAAAPEFLPALAIGAFAGLRTAELQRITWADVDLSPGGVITIGKAEAKTRSRRIVPVLPCLARWLAPYARKKGKVWGGTPETFNDAQQAAALASGVPWKANGLRHSFASYRLAAVQSAAQVSLEMGNSPSVVFKHYRELVRPDAAAAWFGTLPQSPANIVTLNQAA
jgi:integrase